MPETAPQNAVQTSPESPLNPAALRVEDAAKLLSAAAGQQITAEMLRADIDAGAPTNADGTINLVHYAAWLVGQSTQRGSDRG